MNEQEKRLISNFSQQLRQLLRTTSDSDGRRVSSTLVLPVWFQRHLSRYLQFSHLDDEDLDSETLSDLEFVRFCLRAALSFRLEGGSADVLPVDISGFAGCRRLELRRVPLHLVTGLEGMRPRLESLQVNNCPHTNVEFVLKRCLADVSQNPQPWPQLRWLDLTCCNIRSPVKLDVLPSLVSLSLAFNRLSSVPVFSVGVRLNTLCLQHNCLECLDGVEILVNLKELDVSFNLLIGHDTLGPVSMLPKLVTLNTEGNPLAVRPEHRRRSLAWVHRLVEVSSFELDGLKLSSREYLMVGLSKMLPSGPAGLANGVESVVQPASASSALASLEVRTGNVLAATQSDGDKRRKKGIVREAEIAEPEFERKPPSSKVGASVEVHEHLQAKLQIEQLRRTFGEDNWLQGDSGDQVQDVLGLEKTDTRNLADVIAQRLADIQSREQKEQDMHRFVAESSEKAQQVRADLSKNKSAASSVSSSTPSKADVALGGVDMTSSFYSMYAKGQEAEALETDDKVVEVLVKLPNTDTMEPRNLRISGEFLREESKSGLLLEQWFIHSIEACDVPRNDALGQLHLQFSVPNREKRERVYQLDDSSRAVLMSIISPVLEAQARHSLRLEALQCVKCQTEFTFDVKKLGTRGKRKDELQPTCPSCQSSMVIEMESTPMPVAASSSEVIIPPAKKQSEALAESVGSCHSLNEVLFRRNLPESHSSTPKKKKTEEAMTVSANPKTLRAKKSLYTTVGSDKVFNRINIASNNEASVTSLGENSDIQRSESSSDISVLSNPSQSSIEVLPQKPSTTATPETQEYGEPEVKTSALTPLTKVANNVMLESSSSGSMAESIIRTTEEEAGFVDHEGEVETVEVAEDVISQLDNGGANGNVDSGFYSNRHQEWNDHHSDQDTTTDDTSSYRTCRSEMSSLSMVTAQNTLTNTSSESLFNFNDLTTTPKAVRSSSTSSGLGTKEMTTPGRSRMIFEAIKTSFSESNMVEGIKIPQDNQVRDLALIKSIMEWDYVDFGNADHRVKLYCDLTLCHEPDEVVLCIAKTSLKSQLFPRIFIGVVAVTSRQVHLLRITKPETEDPSEWLEVVESSKLSSLLRLVRLIGGQGFSLEFQSGSMHVLFRDRGRTDKFIQQLSAVLLENVRSSPIPVVDLSAEDESVVAERLKSHAVSDESEAMRHFQLGILSSDMGKKRERVSVALTHSHCVILADFFQWKFTGPTVEAAELSPIRAAPIVNLKHIELYDTQPARMTLTWSDSVKLDLEMETEDGVLGVLLELKSSWESHHGQDFEDILIFNFLSQNQAWACHFATTRLQDSVEPSAFEMSEWVQVIKKKLSSE